MALPKPATMEGGLYSAKSRTAPDTPNVSRETRQSNDCSLESLLHSPGCPKYKSLVKSMRQASRSPTRSPTGIHPKPWGARDPKQIPCTCVPVWHGMKSAPSSVRTSPIRELRKVSPLKRTAPPPDDVAAEGAPSPGKVEVLKMFEEFCGRSDELGVKLSRATLDDMCIQLRTKLGVRGASMSPIRSVTQRLSRRRATSTVDEKRSASETEKRTVIAEVFEKRTQSQQSNGTREQSAAQRLPSASVRGKVEASNVMVEIAAPDFPEPGAPFPNIFGSMLPHERPFHYVALGGGNQFFGPEMIVPSIPTATILTYADSSDTYIPYPEVVPPTSRGRGPHLGPGRFQRRRP